MVVSHFPDNHRIHRRIRKCSAIPPNAQRNPLTDWNLQRTTVPDARHVPDRQSSPTQPHSVRPCGVEIADLCPSAIAEQDSDAPVHPWTAPKTQNIGMPCQRAWPLRILRSCRKIVAVAAMRDALQHTQCAHRTWQRPGQPFFCVVRRHSTQKSWRLNGQHARWV